MMTSSGSGAYRVGGSLSSSNLSPLAPPFKVDKSLPKPNSTNPAVNFSELPMYGSCFDPTPGQFWNSSSPSTSGPNCVATESVVNTTNCSSSAHTYGYRDTQSSSSPANVYYANSNAVPAYDPFSYEFPNRMSTKTDEAAKPYYPPYVPPPPQKDEYLGLGVGSGTSYDLLSYSGSAHLSGRGSAQVDHPQTMSGDGRYKSKWGFSWSGLNENEHGKWTDYTPGFVSKDLSSSSSNRSPLFVDASNKSQPFVDINFHPFADGSNNTHLFGDMSNKRHPKQGACVTQDLSLHGQVSTVKDKCFDIFGGGYSLGSLGMGQQDCKSSSECSRMQTSSFASVSKESPHPHEPVLESIPSFCGSQKVNSSSPEDHFNQTGFYLFGHASTTSTFPMTMTKLPCGGSSSSVESTPSTAKLNSLGIDAATQSNTAVGYSSSYQMEPQMPLGSKRQSGIRIRRPVPSSTAASPCQIGETADSRLDDKGVSEKRKFSAELPHQLSLEALNMEASDAEAVYSAEKYSGGSDGHNPAEDSPCWKGASSNYFSPFGRSESVPSDLLVKKIDRCRSLGSQDLQNKSFFSNSSASKDFYSGKVNEVTSLGRTPVPDYTSNQNDDCGSVNPKSCCFDLNIGDGLQFTDDCLASKMSTMNKSNADSDPKHSLTAQLDLSGKLPSSRNISAAPPSEKIGKNTPAASESFFGLPSNIVNNCSNSLPVNEASVKSASEDSDSRIDVGMLLRTMMNLSEILRCYCFSYQVEEIQSVAIKQIINNLNASMSMMVGQTIPTNVLSSPDSFLQKDFPAVQMVNNAEAFSASLKLGRTTEEILDYVSMKDDRNPFTNTNMTEAVKKLLTENLQEEEIDQQKLLYRNLWLEAEASLCVMTAKARFLRMKTEMKKKTHDGVKDEVNPTTSSDVSADLHRAVELATEDEDKDSPLHGECPKTTTTTTSQHNHIEVFHIPKPQVASSHFSEHERSGSTKPGASGNDTDDSLVTSHVNDFETCVMARYQILRNRVGCSDSIEPKCPSSLYDSGNGFHAADTTTKENDIDTSVFGGYQILKCRDENSDYLNYDGKLSPGDENYLPGHNSSLCPDKALQDSQMSNSLGVVNDELKDSIMARFRIIQSRMDGSNLMLVNDSTPSTAVAEDGTEQMGGSQPDFNIKKISFGPYPELTEDEDVNILDIGVLEQGTGPIVKSSVIFEGWYDNNDCSSSADWEHISSRDV
ncbi:uncharacterized protein [Spinacia oleracea]|uniref:Uncharacterized protein n=1 Tax=Spinacia oleracea TaxID=3562 RepID=A0A9R0IZE4_SPIOL|nr:uncharacterized protein LOC110797690 [Spinacia oleracea]XP_021858493.2 uncharacterized protein LOC110797690 [Spinacia oleracea]